MNDEITKTKILLNNDIITIHDSNGIGKYLILEDEKTILFDRFCVHWDEFMKSNEWEHVLGSSKDSFSKFMNLWNSKNDWTFLKDYVVTEVKKTNDKKEVIFAKGTFQEHLVSVWKILTIWNQRQDLSRCGLFHSAYSNSYVNFSNFKS
jgi:hypothetical protein